MGHIFYLLYRIAYTPLKILKHELQHTFKNIEHPEAAQYMKVNWRSETTGKKCLQNKLCCCCLFLFVCAVVQQLRKGSDRCHSSFSLQIFLL